MDIHAPMEPIHSWRDIALHLGIITIGLLIALSLEGLVEYVHHRHLLAEARANIRQELEDNHKSAQDDLARLQKNILREQANIRTLHALMLDPKHFRGSLDNTFSFNSMDEAAWRTARDTGALSFMPYDEVQKFSDLYMVGGLVNSTADTIAQRDYMALAPTREVDDIGSLPPAEFTQMLRDNAAVEVQLTVLKQIVQQYDDLCLKDLKK